MTGPNRSVSGFVAQDNRKQDLRPRDLRTVETDRPKQCSWKRIGRKIPWHESPPRRPPTENGSPAKPKATKRPRPGKPPRRPRRSRRRPTAAERRSAARRRREGHSPGDRREPQEGQVDQQVPRLRLRRQGQHGARPRPPQAQARARRRRTATRRPTRSCRPRRTRSAS